MLKLSRREKKLMRSRKTRMCPTSCGKMSCNFAHTLSELRTVDAQRLEHPSDLVELLPHHARTDSPVLCPPHTGSPVPCRPELDILESGRAWWSPPPSGGTANTRLTAELDECQERVSSEKSCNLTKTKICRDFEAGGCPHGVDCRFAHGIHELQERKSAACAEKEVRAFKTRLCEFFHNIDGRGCKKGHACDFAHGEQELRSKCINDSDAFEADWPLEQSPMSSCTDGTQASGLSFSSTLSSDTFCPPAQVCPLSPAPVQCFIAHVPMVPVVCFGLVPG